MIKENVRRELELSGVNDSVVFDGTFKHHDPGCQYHWRWLLAVSWDDRHMFF